MIVTLKGRLTLDCKLVGKICHDYPLVGSMREFLRNEQAWHFPRLSTSIPVLWQPRLKKRA